MKATVTSKGQIIPLAIRRKLELHHGTVLEFDERADHLKATKAADVARMRSIVGVAKKELAAKTGQEWLDELRGPIDRPQDKRRR